MYTTTWLCFQLNVKWNCEQKLPLLYNYIHFCSAVLQKCPHTPESFKCSTQSRATLYVYNNIIIITCALGFDTISILYYTHKEIPPVQTLIYFSWIDQENRPKTFVCLILILSYLYFSIGMKKVFNKLKYVRISTYCIYICNVVSVAKMIAITV